MSWNYPHCYISQGFLFSAWAKEIQWTMSGEDTDHCNKLQLYSLDCSGEKKNKLEIWHGTGEKKTQQKHQGMYTTTLLFHCPVWERDPEINSFTYLLGSSSAYSSSFGKTNSTFQKTCSCWTGICSVINETRSRGVQAKSLKERQKLVKRPPLVLIPTWGMFFLLLTSYITISSYCPVQTVQN